jgi:hypothetical protein
MQKPEIDFDWVEPQLNIPTPPKPSRKEKAKNKRERKKHYKLINKIRSEIIQEHFPEHIDHMFRVVDTRYDNDVFKSEHIICDCQYALEISKEMFEAKYGKEYKLILPSA